MCDRGGEVIRPAGRHTVDLKRFKKGLETQDMNATVAKIWLMASS
jgi:hypothetical protein